MNNQEKTEITGKKTGIWKKIGAVALFIASAVVGITEWGGKALDLYDRLKPKSAVATAAQTVPVEIKVAKVKVPAAAPTRPLIQFSEGNQSPNIQHVKASVRFRYGALEQNSVPANPTQTKKLAVSAHNSSVTQISTGAQSPNVNGVDGDVVIDYNTLTPATSTN